MTILQIRTHVSSFNSVCSADAAVRCIEAISNRGHSVIVFGPCSSSHQICDAFFGIGFQRRTRIREHRPFVFPAPRGARQNRELTSYGGPASSILACPASAESGLWHCRDPCAGRQAGLAGIDRGHLDGAIRLDLPDECVRAVLDHEGGATAFEARRVDHQHVVGRGTQSA